MGYSQQGGRRPFERASKIAHTEVLNNPQVQEFVEGCRLPSLPDVPELDRLLVPVGAPESKVKTVIAIDGGMTEVTVRKEYPSASVAYLTFGPLLFSLSDLDAVDNQTFIAPEDMAKLKNLERYSLVMPVRQVRPKTSASFSAGARQTVQRLLMGGDGHLMAALRWLLFQEWDAGSVATWTIPRCPAGCEGDPVVFRRTDPSELPCPGCGEPVLLADALRLYERIDEEQGAGAILSYLLTGLEQLVLVRLLKAIWELKPSVLREVLFVKDGPLAFFGVTAPLQAPMRALVKRLADGGPGGPLIRLVGLDKSGPFVEHAMQIEPHLKPGSVLIPSNDYIYKYIEPGDPTTQSYGRNTYYGTKMIFKSTAGHTYVATVASPAYQACPSLADVCNGAEVLCLTGRLHCSMYDNALIPVVLANRLVSLADLPSAQILAKFTVAHLGR